MQLEATAMEKPVWVTKAEEIARQAHASQKRQDGSPYIAHPAAVAQAAAEYGPAAEAAAWLHDVLEDNQEWTAKRLVDEGIPPTVVSTVCLLTRGEGESYLGYLLAIKTSPEAKRIKLADLEHNLSDLKRGSLRDKYLLAKWILENT